MATLIKNFLSEANPLQALSSGVKRSGCEPGPGPAPGTVAGGEFDLGSTLVKLSHRCAKASSGRTGTSHGIERKTLDLDFQYEYRA